MEHLKMIYIYFAMSCEFNFTYTCYISSFPVQLCPFPPKKLFNNQQKEMYIKGIGKHISISLRGRLVEKICWLPLSCLSYRSFILSHNEV